MAAVDSATGTAQPLTDAEFSVCIQSFLNRITNEHIAVAVSGGPDSMALAFLLSRWAETQTVIKLPIHALIVDHGLRSGSAEEAERTKIRLQNLPHILPFVLNWAHDGQGSRVQEEARHARYHLMAAHCRAHGIKCLFLGHHQDDQAETLLLRLAAGSGLDGLGGMRNIQPIDEGRLNLLRPFLQVPKDRLLATCSSNGIACESDPSNQAERFARVRMRQASDVLEREGLSSKRLSVTAARLARAREALDHYAQELFSKALTDSNPERIVLKSDVLRNAPEETSLRVVIKSIALLRPDHPYLPRMEKIEALHADLISEKDFQARTLGGLIFRENIRDNEFTIMVEKAAAGSADPA